VLSQLGLERGPDWESTKLWLSIAQFPVIRDGALFEKFVRHPQVDRVKLTAFSEDGLRTTVDIARALETMQKAYRMIFGEDYDHALDGVIERLDTGAWRFKDVTFLTDVIEAAYGRFCAALHSDRRRSVEKLDSPVKCAKLLRQEMELAQATRDLYEDWEAFGEAQVGKRPAGVSGGGSELAKRKKKVKSSGLATVSSTPAHVEKRHSSTPTSSSANLPASRLPCFQHLMALCGVGGVKECGKGSACRFWHVELPKDKTAALAALEESLSRPFPGKLLGSLGKDLREALGRF
jgi:hypothetical protein